jgi:hypothetical protein
VCKTALGDFESALGERSSDLGGWIRTCARKAGVDQARDPLTSRDRSDLRPRDLLGRHAEYGGVALRRRGPDATGGDKLEFTR